KNMGSDGGLWVAILSPRAIARAQEIKDSGRWIPTSLDLVTAIENSRKDQTYNTPAVATLLLLAEQIEWINESGGLAWAAERTRTSSGLVYDGADAAEAARPYVVEPADRSPLVATIDFDESIDAAAVASALRDNGVVDVEPYRKLGRNPLRLATFVSVDPADVKALLACIDFVVDGLQSGTLKEDTARQGTARQSLPAGRRLCPQLPCSARERPVATGRSRACGEGCRQQDGRPPLGTRSCCPA